MTRQATARAIALRPIAHEPHSLRSQVTVRPILFGIAAAFLAEEPSSDRLPCWAFGAYRGAHLAGVLLATWAGEGGTAGELEMLAMEADGHAARVELLRAAGGHARRVGLRLTAYLLPEDPASELRAAGFVEEGLSRRACRDERAVQVRWSME